MEKNETLERVAVAAVRDAPTEGIEVLLIRDPDSAHHGFPHSPVLDVDITSRAIARCRGISREAARRSLDHRKTGLRCLGTWVAASRTLFLWTGILFCSSRVPQGTGTRPLSRRRLGDKDALDFVRLLESEDLVCDLTSLRPFAKWADTRGGETQFFLAPLPSELYRPTTFAPGAAGEWLSPEKAMVRWQRGHISLDFTTYGCLRVLSDFQSTQSLLAEYRRTAGEEVRE